MNPDEIAQIAVDAVRAADVNGSAPLRSNAAFFDKTRFVPKALGDHLHAEAPIASGGALLHRYQAGAYRPAEDALKAEIADLLGDRWNHRHERETTAYLRAVAPALQDRPSLDVVNVSNGLLRIDTGELRNHDPAHLAPVQIPIEYDPAARCPQVERFLADVLPADALPAFLQLAGLLLVPDVTHHKAVMFVGPGGNGKSVALHLLTSLVGEENVSNVPLHALEEERFAVADLYGRLANVFADLDARALRGSSVFKALVGGDRMRGERKHRDSFEFKPYARCLFSANQAPPTSDSSTAFFDRWLVFPFESRFRGTEREDRDLVRKLADPRELSGFLNLALDGLRQLRAGGFTASASMSGAHDSFRQDTDSVAGFVAERIALQPLGRVTRKDVFRAYQDWCADNGRHPLAARRFTGRLRELAPDAREVKAGGERLWDGIELEAEL